MIHLPIRPGAVVRINTQRLSDIVVMVVTCASGEAASQVLSEVETRLSAHDYDLAPVVALDAPDPFSPGVKVHFEHCDWELGSQDVEATVIRRVGPTSLLLRLGGGWEVEKDERDLELVARPH